MRKAYIGNIPFDTTPSDIRREFGEYGEIVDISIPESKKGICFVTYREENSASLAISAGNGKTVLGRPVKVSQAFRRPGGGKGDGGKGGGKGKGGKGYDDRRFSPPRGGYDDRGRGGGYDDRGGGRDYDRRSPDRRRDDFDRDRDRDRFEDRRGSPDRRRDDYDRPRESPRYEDRRDDYDRRDDRRKEDERPKGDGPAVRAKIRELEHQLSVVGEHRSRLTEEEQLAIKAKASAADQAQQAVEEASAVSRGAEEARKKAQDAANEAESAKMEMQSLREEADKWQWELGRLQAALASFVQLHERLEAEKNNLADAERDLTSLTAEREAKLAAVIASTKGGNFSAPTTGGEGDDYDPGEAAGNIQGDSVFPIIGSAPSEVMSGAINEPITAAEKRAMERRARMELEAMDDGDATEPEPDPEPEPAPVPVQVALTPPAKKKKKLPSNFLSM